ncbi:Protein-S-isoprenylcysteine O-methyltransferase Ste14 [Rhizobium mongolense subsp. loessense]|uniref:Protein-S-isoprenylcysteine O-methyltransferase Ste14 n=1 Tax=Rhizobium mongolense subsp. loessense TaxID=158890 RepID=A0A1G4U5L0_9HYPH|nr:isoprenylcysteine carboxylmethyltransferase family protein [Rhizobium mongolense]SCW88942.1 Protein-S-isoprenylcysteine O-methyltransferase Ste14 [Rhizobium mongolense subsp. loessense]
MKTVTISIGNFLFRYRNQIFPFTIVTLFFSAAPATEVFESTKVEFATDIAAWLIAFCGLLVRGTVIGYAYIQRGGLNKEVYAKNLVTEGMFSTCRNPLYVGNLLIYAAVFLMHGNPATVAIGILLFCVMYQCIVCAEEAFLERKFGEGYRAYCADVPRWIPRLAKISQATEGMVFNFKRVIAKDYSTVSATLVTLLLAQVYESMAAPIANKDVLYLSLLVTLAIVTGVATGLISRLKKRGVFSENKSV